MDNRTHILKELAEIAPNLAAMPKTNPFLVPKDYFASLEQSATQIIGNTPTQVEVPENYFETLPEIILAKAKQGSPGKLISINKWSWTAAAAAVLVIISASLWMYNQTPNTPINSEFASEIGTVEALDYLISEGDLTLSDVLDMNVLDEDIFNDRFEEVEFGESILDDVFDDLSTTQLEEFL